MKNQHETQSESRFGDNIEVILFREKLCYLKDALDLDEKDEVRSAYF